MGELKRLKHKLGHWRAIARSLLREVPFLRRMPPHVAAFYLRAVWTAWRSGDTYSLKVSTRPEDVATLLRLAEGHDRVIELGTATGWTSVAFAISDDRRRVRSYDPEIRPERERYIALAGPARERIELQQQRAEEATPEPGSAGLLFIDCAHDRETTRDAFRAFEAAVQPGGAVAFHDYGHPRYPGVFQAVEELGLRGVTSGGMFIWRKPHA
jgi:predicted O-methyltransferase YrrM